MGNFLYNVEKSRKEWLKKPNPVPTRARYLNANLNTSLVEEVVVIDAQVTSDSNPESVLEPISELKTETITE
jgi:predicted component of viral defense system (DUF524 family)